MGGTDDLAVLDQELARHVVQMPALVWALIVVCEYLPALTHQDDLETTGCRFNVARNRTTIGNIRQHTQQPGITHTHL